VDSLNGWHLPFQATVLNRPGPPHSGHCEMQRKIVVFPRCQLRTVHPADPLSFGYDKSESGASYFVLGNRLELCSLPLETLRDHCVLFSFQLGNSNYCHACRVASREWSQKGQTRWRRNKMAANISNSCLSILLIHTRTKILLESNM
jgi:hypothetical protein